ncbi:hypothetical protein L596_006158 [Steinernema carpocapsae]|uniref:Uncharacterized protein n=1 Tax=Steinernema carpocapsae TaxID=34508 RepID=A0A4U8V1C3_STECR|nr:hypothetical protein L596_006158 [Steinernema carpocapsae]
MDRYDVQFIFVSPYSKVSVSQEFFGSMFAKFLECKFSLKFLQGCLEFDQDYLLTLRLDLQVKLKKDKGRKMLTWKSPIDCRDFFQVEFLDEEVKIFTHNMGQCICENVTKMPHMLMKSRSLV